MNADTIKRLSKLDKTLAKLIREVGLIDLKPNRRQSPYEALVESVVYQQLTGRAAETIFGRVKALFDHGKCPTPEEILAAPIETLRSAGLSNAKALAIKDIAAKTLEGWVPDSRSIARMEDGQIIERLTAIRGVGQWTAEMLLIFKLGRPDVLPSADYGVRKGFALTYRKRALPSPKDLMAFGERWKPFRTTAAWYLWRAVDKQKGNR